MRKLLVPLAVIGMLVSVLLPLPTWLIDILLVSNLVLAAVMLVTTLFITDPLRLSSLPSMLLLATLYRLALNISTTRAILSSGKGGAVIEAFGAVVMSGNPVIGLVIFLVITLIQFIVIAKGSERVAEVCARFTLDALPGKQMSIDADVRSGLIDFAEARRKRQELQTESRFYGALDGAMKFIKGDAIAGLVITSINIVGGFTIGVLMQGASLGAAFRQYTLLSIGEGLLAQLPAVLSALAAGMVVTRVARDDALPLAEELLAQLGQEQKVCALVAILAAGAALLPGMPVLPFALIAALLTLAALARPAASSAPPADAAAGRRFRPKIPALLQLDLNAALAAQLLQRGFGQQLRAWQQAVFDRYGLILTLPDLNSREDQSGYCISMRSMRAAGRAGALTAEQAGAEILEALLELVAERKEEFIDDTMTRRLLDNLESEAPELAAAVIPGVVSVTQLTALIRELVREGVSVRSFDMIVQAVAEFGGKSQNDRQLLEHVRIALRRVICAAFAEDGAVRAYLLDPLVDLAFARAERNGDSVEAEHIARVAEELAGRWRPGEVLLVSRAARKTLRDGLALRDLRIPVLAYDEVINSVRIEQLAVVGELAGDDPGEEHALAA